MTQDISDIRAQKLACLVEYVQGIAESTATATDDILGICENLHADNLQDGIAHIFKACAVQDLTNQRIKKILDLARQIETGTYNDEDVLLEGPQRKHNALSQDDVDSLLNQAE